MHKFLAIILCIIGLSPAFASECVHSSFGYGDVGLGPFPVPLPNFGLGFRRQFHQNGFDLSLNATTIICATALKGSALYHFYPKPSYCSQFYYGAGLGAGTIFYTGEQNLYFVSPEFVVGKSYLTDTGDRRFFQMQASWPTFSVQERPGLRKPFQKQAFYFPLIVFSYGIGF